jgi:hypothetical protein
MLKMLLKVLIEEVQDLHQYSHIINDAVMPEKDKLVLILAFLNYTQDKTLHMESIASISNYPENK